ncbi:hypothetical protein [Aureliella helgolandensis]|nr:hypothetical protein [Aureliella helgolandensis]
MNREEESLQVAWLQTAARVDSCLESLAKRQLIFALSLLVLSLCVLCGCQAGASGFPMQNMTRVPPPGTGTYQTSGDYYNNNTSAVPVSSNGQSAGATLAPVGGNLPTTNLTASSNSQVNPVSASASSSVFSDTKDSIASDPPTFGSSNNNAVTPASYNSGIEN